MIINHLGMLSSPTFSYGHVSMTQEQGSRSKIANFQKILASNPHSFIFAQLAEEHMKFGETDQALAICREGLSHNPDFADGKFVLAKTLFRSGAKDEAVRELFEILQLQPEHYNAKETLLRMGHSESSIQSTLRSMKTQAQEQAPAPAPTPAPPQVEATPPQPAAPAQAVQPQQAVVESEEDSFSLEIDLDTDGLDQAPGNELPTPQTTSPEPPVGMPQPAEERNVAPASQGNRSIPQGAGTQMLPPTSPRQTLSVMGAQKADVDAATLQQHQNEEEKKSRTGLWVALILVVIALGVGGFFGGRYVLKEMAQKEMQKIYQTNLQTAQQDTYQGYQTVLRTLPPAINQYGKGGKLSALLVESYAKVLMDFAPDNLGWQDQLEQQYKRFPADPSQNAALLTALGYRALLLAKPAEIRFALDEAAKKNLLTPDLLTLEGEALVRDKEYKQAKAKLSDVLKKHPNLLRARYVLARVLVLQEDLEAARAELETLLKQDPNHLRAQLLQFELRMTTLEQTQKCKPDLDSFAKAKGDKLPALLKAELNYLQAKVLLADNRHADAINLLLPLVNAYNRGKYRFVLAMAQEKSGEYEKALMNAKEAAKQGIQPKDVGRFLGMLYYKADRKTDALAEFDKVINDKATDLELLTVAADAAFRLKNYEKASFFYERATFVDLKNPELQKKLALCLIEKEELSEARKVVDRLSAEHPGSALPYFLEGRLLLAEEQPDKAEKVFEKGATNDPTNVDVQIELAKLHLQKQEFRKGMKILVEQLEKHPKEIRLLSLLGENYLYGSSLKNARSMYDTLTALEPQIIDYRAQLAYIDFLEGKPVEAEKQLRSLLTTHPQHAEANIYLGAILLDNGMEKQAEDAIRKGIKYNSRNPYGHYYMGRLKLLQGDQAWAKNEFSIALECQANHPDTHVELGKLYVETNQLEKARNEFKQAEAMFSLFEEGKRKRVEVMCRQAEIEISLGRVRKGLQLIKQANKLDPEAAEPYYILAREQNEFRQPQKVLDLLLKARTYDDGLAPVYYELGVVYQVMDKKKEAAQNLREYIKRSPKGVFVLDAKKRLDEMGE